MPRPPRREFQLTGEDIGSLSAAVRSKDTSSHIRDAAVIMLVSVDTPAYETSAVLLDIDKREVDRVQKAFMAGGVPGVLNIPLGRRAIYHGKLKDRENANVAHMETILTLPPELAPENVEQLSQMLNLSKDYSRKLAKKHGVEIPEAYSNEVLGEKIRALLETKPKRRAWWSYLEAAEALGINRETLARCCKRFKIKFPEKEQTAVTRAKIEKLLQTEPQSRAFWTYVELGQRLGISRTQAQSYCVEFGIALPPHPLEAKIRALLTTPPPDGDQWTYPELARRVGMNRSWVREFCLKKGLDLAK